MYQNELLVFSVDFIRRILTNIDYPWSFALSMKSENNCRISSGNRQYVQRIEIS